MALKSHLKDQKLLQGKTDPKELAFWQILNEKEIGNIFPTGLAGQAEGRQ